MKQIVLVLTALVALGGQSEAQIGRTLEQCEQRYGKPVSAPNRNIDPGVIQYHFVSGKLDASVRISTNTHTATAVYYSKLDHGPFSGAEIKQLLHENGPELNWSVDQDAHPARSDDKSWVGQKDGKAVLNAMYAHLEEGEGYVLNIYPSPGS